MWIKHNGKIISTDFPLLPENYISHPYPKRFWIENNGKVISTYFSPLPENYLVKPYPKKLWIKDNGKIISPYFPVTKTWERKQSAFIKNKQIKFAELGSGTISINLKIGY